jgi:queuosine precursor transporter
MPNNLLLTILISNYIFKCSVEVLFTPLTYLLINFLKKREHEDHYDHGISYNPFTMEV